MLRYVKRLPRYLLLLLLPAMIGAPIHAVLGDEPQKSAEPVISAQKTPAELLAEKRAQVAAQIEALKQSEADPGEKETTLHFLERLQYILSQHEASQKQQEALKQEREQLKALLDSPAWADGLAKIDTFTELEKLREELASLEAQKEALEISVEARRAALADAERELSKRESERRQASEAAAAAPENRQAALALELARLRSEHARELRDQRAADRQNEELRAEILELQARLLRRKIARVAPEVDFTKEDLRAKLRELQEWREEAERGLAQAQKKFDSLEKQWLSSRRRLESAQMTPAVRAERETRKELLDLKQIEISHWGKIPELLDLIEETWKRRFELQIGEQGGDKLAAWAREADTAAERLRVEQRLSDAQVGALQKQLSLLRSENERLGAEGGAGRWIDQEIEAVESALAVIRRYNQALEQTRRVTERLHAELDVQRDAAPLFDRLREVRQFFSDVWRYEIIAVEDSSVSIGDIIYALVLLIIGAKISRAASQQVGGKIMRHFGVEEGHAAAIQSLIFYVLFLIFGLFALKLINVPLTVFTLFGGAIAIGVGFGSQNIMNNFISGPILLIEQPVRVGDLVEVDGQITGTVKRIGLRSALIRTGQNIDVIVPNNRFLEQNVVNWTLSSSKVRLKVVVGVAYGSDVKKVEELLLTATEDNSRVIKYPKPFVWFSDFGDSALVFELHFWARVKTVADRYAAESSLRFSIDELFAQHGVVIAFPQRDVHLDMSKPLEVKMVS